MDIGRTQLNNVEPRHRLDAGSYGTMGVGFGFAVAAAVVQPERPVVSVSGRLGVRLLRHGARDDLPLPAADHDDRAQQRRHRRRLRELAGRPAAAAVERCRARARYEKVIEAFGGQGYYVEDPADLRADARQGDLVGQAVGRPRPHRRPSRPQAPGVPLEDVMRRAARTPLQARVSADDVTACDADLSRAVRARARRRSGSWPLQCARCAQGRCVRPVARFPEHTQRIDLSVAAFRCQR